MDDFYDTDIGVQTSDILVLPSAFLGTLWTELQTIGNNNARKIMFKCGHTVGVNLYYSHDYKNSLKALQKVVEKKPDEISLLNYVGMDEIFLKKYPDAEKTFKKIIKKEPKIDLGYMGLAFCYHKWKKYDKAMKYYDKVLEINPENKKARVLRAEMVREKALFSQDEKK
jgi:tetratricopeptide (TPR) repeat protein